MHFNAKDYTGQRFGYLVALKPLGKRKGHNIVWLCECDCGNLTEVSTAQLSGGRKKSCGCLWKKKMTKHGYGGTKTYKSYKSMITRCYDDREKKYAIYGGRGITVCERWLADFKFFIEDMGECPPKYSLDRIDPDKGYSPDNCRWADIYVQNNNKRSNRVITFKGVSKTLAQWARHIGMTPEGLSGRLEKWPIEIALTKPKGGIRKNQNKGRSKNQQLSFDF